jgi:hypothetical protein
MPKTLAERAWEKGKAVRPTIFVPNGCGPAATGPVDLVPDSFLGVKFGHECCDVHDLEYYRGGFLGLFWRKPKADYRLAACMTRRMWRAGRENLLLVSRAKKAKGYAQMFASGHIGLVYGLAVTLFGWSPFTWGWKERELPTHEQLVAIGESILPDSTTHG